MGEPERVWVFIDQQNCYRDARRAYFQDTDPASCGQVDPRKLGQLLVEKGMQEGHNYERVLSEVRVYMGLPSPDKQPTANAADMRKGRIWQADNVTLIRRPLRYPRKWPVQPAQEKGIDVALAVDLIFFAVRKHYDVGIICSTDTDLVPALEAVCNLRRAWGAAEAPRLEVAAWNPPRKRLSVPNFPIWCHHLTREDYELVKDPTNYTLPRDED